MTEHAKGFNELYGVSLAADGTILVAEGGEGRVLAINGSDVKVKGSGLARPTGIAAAADGSCYVSEAGKGRVVHLNGAATSVIDGLKDPQGLLLAGDDLYVLDAEARELVGYSLKMRTRTTVASNLPVGARRASRRKCWLVSQVCYRVRCGRLPVLRPVQTVRSISQPTGTAACSHCDAHKRSHV